MWDTYDFYCKLLCNWNENDLSYDPMWDDDEPDWEFSSEFLVDEDEEYDDYVHTVPDDDNEVFDATKTWVSFVQTHFPW